MLKLPVSNDDHVFEVLFSYEGEGDKDLHLIYEVSNAKEEMRFGKVVVPPAIVKM
ncbi:MAG: hypothetical protein H7282_02195 [Cytophagaceae bacterium]|nr:hypothetical protein [Cytophagaceae bacterium]